MVDAFLAYLKARKAAAPWSPGDDVAVSVGGGVERARTHEQHGTPDTETVVLALLDPAGQRQPTEWLRCPREAVAGPWDDAFAPLSHPGIETAP
ncbi:hypothetical protein [Streptacidiphilus anmyonensis]|uniref:hypothetical protein n=1 Tax=Streptacidiphilus anmyonensis TaxID=405782 RepID=UPI0005A81FC7|nr:hypothetical protein [Streptacidiphilus anmyonensis]